MITNRKEIKLYKAKSILDVTEKDSLYCLKADNETEFKIIVTDAFGNPVNLKDLTGGTITNIINTDGSITITGSGVKDIKLSTTLYNLINSALQAGDSISSLTNDSNFITLGDIPTFNPLDYDLTDFTNSDADPFARLSDIVAGSGIDSVVAGTNITVDNTDPLNPIISSTASGATNLGYTPSSTDGTVTSDSGSDATIPLANNTNAGLLSPSEKSDIASAIQPSDLATVATSGDYTDLINIPTEFNPSAHTHPISDIVNLQIELDSKVDETTTVNGQALSSNVVLTTDDIQEIVTPTNKWWTNLRTISSALTGLSSSSGTFSATDTILFALGKSKYLIDNIATLYQAILVSGTNIKTVNGSTLLGAGNLAVGDALVANPLSQFAPTTSAQLATVISDETGSGALVFANSPTLSNPIVGTQIQGDNSTKAASTAYVDTGLGNAMSKSANGSDIVNIKTFRANLGVDKLTQNGDSNYTVLSTDKVIVTSGTFTLPRTWTLPLANSVNAGYEIIIADLFGGVTSTNNLVISRAGSDTINGVTTLAISATYGMRRLISDGTSKWTFDAGVMRVSDYIGATLGNSLIVGTDSSGKLITLSTGTYPSLTELSYVKGVTSAIQTQFDTVNVNVITITTAVSITTDTTNGSYGQHGRHVKISNGANAINIQCVSTSNADFVASYEKLGASNITFTAGAGITLTTLSGTAILSGVAGSKACLSRTSGVYYLQITNY